MVVPSEFWEIQWVDVVIWSAGFMACALASGSVRIPKFGKQSETHAAGLFMRFLTAIEAAFAACIVMRRPSPRSHAGSSEVDPKNRDALLVAFEEMVRRNGADASFDLLKQMQHSALPVPAYVVERMLQGYSPKEACALLRRMQDAGVTPDVIMYNCFLMLCVNADDMPRGRRIVEEMRKVESGIQEHTLKGLLACGDMNGAKCLLNEMVISGQNPSQGLYNAVLYKAVMEGNAQIVWDTLQMMKKSGVPANGHTAQNVMELLRRRESHRKLCSKEISNAIEFLAESGVNFSSNQLLLSTMIDTCVWHAEHLRLEFILEQYWKSGLQPSVRVYGLLIKAANSLSNMDWVWRFWREMLSERKLQPTATVLGCMLDALVRANLVDEAVGIFEQWKARVPPSTIMYATLVKGFLNTNQVDKSMQALREMRLEGVERNRTIYNMVLGVHTENGSVDAFTELLESMRTDGCLPDVITYSTVVKGYCMKGDIDIAMGLLREGQGSGISFDVAIYNTIFFGCYRHSRHDLIDALVLEVVSLGLTPSSFTLTTIVKMYGAQGFLAQAFEAVVSLTRQPVCADTRVVNALLEICTKQVDVDLPEQVFEWHLAGSSDAKFFWPAVACRVLRGEYQQAQRIVKANRTLLNARPKEGTKEELMERLLCRLGQKQDQQKNALKLIEKLRVFDSGYTGRKD